MNNGLKENMARFSRLISAAEEDAWKRCDMQGLTSTQISYLEVIQELNNPTITELASAMGLTKPSVTIAIDRLVATGFIRKALSDTDKRRQHLHLTESGEQINKWHHYAHEYMVDFIATQLNKSEVKTLTALLDKITASKNDE